MGTPDPFRYFDFRLWFRDFLTDYSYSQIIGHLGLKSKGHITQILQGKRNVTPQVAFRIADVAKLDDNARKFLLALIDYTQADTHERKKQALDRMLALQTDAGKTIRPLHYDLCKQWYYPVIRELVRILPVGENLQTLARMVDPPITERAAETALKDLERIGLLVRNSRKRYVQTEAMISFPDGWRSVIVREFQRHAMELQQQALDRFPAEEREIANATFCVSKERAAHLKARLQEFRKEVMSLVKSDPKDPEQVFQLNIGLFPLSKARIK